MFPLCYFYCFFFHISVQTDVSALEYRFYPKMYLGLYNIRIIYLLMALVYSHLRIIIALKIKNHLCENIVVILVTRLDNKNAKKKKTSKWL